MKTKLLRKLRKRFQMYVRNKEYKIIDNTIISPPNTQIGTNWMTKEKAIEKRRKWILEAAKQYKYIKNVVKN